MPTEVIDRFCKDAKERVFVCMLSTSALMAKDENETFMPSTNRIFITGG